MVVDNIEVTLVIAHTLQLYLEEARIGTELIVTDTNHCKRDLLLALFIFFLFLQVFISIIYFFILCMFWGQ